MALDLGIHICASAGSIPATSTPPPPRKKQAVDQGMCTDQRLVSRQKTRKRHKNSAGVL